MEADERPAAVGAPFGAAAAGSAGLSKRGLSGPADEAAAYTGAEPAGGGNVMLRTLQHHPSSANAKLGGQGGGSMYVRWVRNRRPG